MYRQPWFIPLFALVGTIVWLQLTPQNPSIASGVTSFSGGSEGSSLNSEQIKFLISTEIRSQILDKAKTSVQSAQIYPQVANLPDSHKLRIVVTGGSGFVGSHLVDRLMLAGHRY